MKKLISIIMILSILNLSGCGTFLAGSLPKEERGRVNYGAMMADSMLILAFGAGLAFLAIDFATGGAYHREFVYKVENKTADQIYLDLKENYGYTDLLKNDVINALNNYNNKDFKEAIICKAGINRSICAKFI